MIARLRRQPPVHSPLTLDAIGAGVRAMAGGRAGAEARVGRWLAATFGARTVLPTDSGTSALALALRAARRLGATTVALPAYCCFDVATAAAGADVAVVLYDLDPLTLGPNFASLRRALEQGARAVVVAHLHGIPVDLERVRRLAAEFSALVVEDAAQGAGTVVAGRPAGAGGSLGVLSFGRGKGITGGGGGALLANDEAGERALATVRDEVAPGGAGLRPLVASAAQWALARPAIYGLPASLPFLGLGETHYREPAPATAPSAFALGVLGRTACLAAAETATRRAHAARLLGVLGGLAQPHLVPVREARDAVPGYLRLPVLVTGTTPEQVLDDEGLRLGVMPSYPRSLADLAQLRARLRNPAADFAGARLLATNLLTLPTHSRLQPADLGALEGWVRRLIIS